MRGRPDPATDDRVAQLDALYRVEYAGMVRLAYALLANNAEAEEIVQDSFLEVHRRWHDIRKPGAYLRCTVVSRCRSAFTLSLDRSDATDVFDDLVATIDLRPETAVDFPGLTSTFVSPTYGYSFRYHDRGGLEPAAQRWDPVNGQLDDNPSQDWFDAVETGLSAYFQGASAPIPDAVSIDGWIDDHVSPAGCGIARSVQAEITIDGEPGRVAECGNRVEATVVAGGRLYVFSLDHERRDARAFFDAWIATIDLTPETAA